MSRVLALRYPKRSMTLEEQVRVAAHPAVGFFLSSCSDSIDRLCEYRKSPAHDKDVSRLALCWIRFARGMATACAELAMRGAI